MSLPSTVAESKQLLLVLCVFAVITLRAVKNLPCSLRLRTLLCVGEIINYLIQSVEGTKPSTKKQPEIFPPTTPNDRQSIPHTR
jgi:hypothetical protein